MRERLESYAHLVVVVIGALLIGFLIFKYLFIPVVPFLIAWAVAFMLRPASVFIAKKTHIPKKIVALLLTVFTVIVGIGAVVALIFAGVSELWRFISELASDDRLSDILDKISNPLGALFGGENSEYIESQIVVGVKDAVSALLGELFEIVRRVATSVPRALFFILITVIASIYFSLELDNINIFVRKLIPEGVYDRLCNIKRRFFSVGVRYVKAYLVLMLITFFIILAGLLVLRVENALLFAVIISLLDVLPIIGVGTVLVPWGVFQLVFGDFGLGIGLTVLYLVHEIVRQLLEPKIIGKHLGIHPIVSLVLIYVGYYLFGIAGLIVMPIAGSLLAVLFKKEDSSEVT